MEGRITRQALNQSIWSHLLQIREEVKAYAESIGCDMHDVCMFVGENYASAFSIAEKGDSESGKSNVYLIEMTNGKDGHTSKYYEEEKNGKNV